MPITGATDEWADEEAGIEAVQRILDCLDDIYSLQDAHVDADVLRDMLRDNRLHQFLQLFDRIAATVVTSNGRAPAAEAVGRCRDVLEQLIDVRRQLTGRQVCQGGADAATGRPHMQVSEKLG